MGIMVQKDDDLNEDLSRRIDADLKTKMKAASKIEGPEWVDDTEFDPDLFKNIRV
jgi:hypothetical protein